MSNTTPQTIYLKDYQAPEFVIKTTDLLVQIFEDYTWITSKLEIQKNTDSPAVAADLVLTGVELDTLSVSMDGKQLSSDQYKIEGESLKIVNVPARFLLETKVSIKPQQNTSLEGFYKSGDMFCTQCEAEGFRKITWYLDRPDVMSVFTTRIEADKTEFPILLSNGNPVSDGDLADGRHFSEWFDPFKKPAYLFAMVAGKLVRSDSEFVTCSGRTISIQLFVESHNAHKTEFAHGALQRAMKWDEDAYGREYDLDIYMIVASDFFNMGAMENKGLNVFNSARVLALPNTTTDAQFQDIEAVIGHEYFHNWSGNRVTCRDWFQLSLKEGFTVFRDSEFTADLNSRVVKRMDDVMSLKTLQFAEDASPISHPVRPASYMEINNFYTMTIYEKGAEVVRMIHTLLGAERFRKGSDLYFDTNDGKAATIEDFIAAMTQVSGFDFSQFMLWYDQSGTPLVRVHDQYFPETNEYKLTFRQSIAANKGQPVKLPMLIPVKMGLMNQDGSEARIHIVQQDAWNADTGVLMLTEAEQTFTFTGVTSKPVPSLLRDFSAPVNLEFDYSTEELAFLMANDSNMFNRWDASQRLATNVLMSNISRANAGEAMELPDEMVSALQYVVRNKDIDPAITARMLVLPSENLLFEKMPVANVDAIHQARQFVKKQIAEALQKDLQTWYQELDQVSDYRFISEDVAKRALKNVCLGYLALLDDDVHSERCLHQYKNANNFTDVSAAMASLSESNSESIRTELYQDFIANWHQDGLMLEHWLATQSASSKFTVSDIEALMALDYFNMKNPNHVRSVLGRFMMSNLINFHKSDGSGYRFIADQVIALNTLNPQVAARMCTGFRALPKLDAGRQHLLTKQLKRVLEVENLSPDVFENIDRILKG